VNWNIAGCNRRVKDLLKGAEFQLAIKVLIPFLPNNFGEALL
jgi:hypothetical protein